MSTDYRRECNKQEFLFTLNDYGQTFYYTDKKALAVEIQRLLLLEPGSFPNTPEMGIGIKSYMFEFLDSKTLDELKLKIYDQIAKYIPSVQVVRVDVAKYNPNSKIENAIAIKIDILNEGLETDIIISVEKVNISKIESKIYL